jgi:hypothetical protein
VHLANAKPMPAAVTPSPLPISRSTPARAR